METSRRGVIRVIGAGAGTLALAAPLAACDDPAAPAYAPWHGPDASLTDLRLRLLSYAILAPSAHNRQPWLVRLVDDDALELYVDRERLLPATDPYARQIMISQGTFLELLVLAARANGHRPVVTYFPDGMYASDVIEDKPVASVRLVPERTITKDPLFDQILNRRSNKRPYDDDRPLASADLRELGRAYRDRRFNLGLVRRGMLTNQLRDLTARALAREAGVAAAHRESIEALRLTPDEVARHRDGLVASSMGYGGIGGWLARTFFMSKEGLLDPDSFAAKQVAEAMLDRAESAVGFAWIQSRANTRVHQVFVGRYYARLDLKAAEVGVAIHPMSQALQEYPEMAPIKDEIQRLLKLPQGWVVQMLARIGYAAPIPPTPRRDVGDVLKPA